MTEKNFTVVFAGIPHNPRDPKPYKPARTYSCTVKELEDGRYKAEHSGYSQTASNEFLAKQFLMGLIREANDTHSNNNSRWSIS